MNKHYYEVKKNHADFKDKVEMTGKPSEHKIHLTQKQ